MSDLVIINEQAVSQKLQEYYPTTESVEAVANDYRNLIVTEETFEQAKKARQELRVPRYAIQNKRKEFDSILNNLKERSKKLANELIEITRPIEDEIDSSIKEIEAKKAEEKAEKERKKAEQMAEWNQKAQSILSFTDKLINPATENDVKLVIEVVSAIEVTEDDFGAYELIAQQNKDKVLEQAQTVLDSMIEKARVEKEEQERLHAKELSEARELYLDYFKVVTDTLTAPELRKAVEDDKNAKLARLAELERREEERLAEEARIKAEQEANAIKLEAESKERAGLEQEYRELMDPEFFTDNPPENFDNDELKAMIKNEADRYKKLKETAVLPNAVEIPSDLDNDLTAISFFVSKLRKTILDSTPQVVTKEGVAIIGQLTERLAEVLNSTNVE